MGPLHGTNERKGKAAHQCKWCPILAVATLVRKLSPCPKLFFILAPVLLVCSMLSDTSRPSDSIKPLIRRYTPFSLVDLSSKNQSTGASTDLNAGTTDTSHVDLNRLMWEDPCDPEAPWPYTFNGINRTYREGYFHPEWHPRRRSDRFPSVEQRVQIYMGNWYVPPQCVERNNRAETAQFSYRYEGSRDESNGEGSILEREVTISPGPNDYHGEPLKYSNTVRTSSFPTVATMLRSFRPDHIYFFESGLQEPLQLNCPQKAENVTKGASPSKCKDIKHLIGVLSRVNTQSGELDRLDDAPPILISPGDRVTFTDIPIFSKTRWSATKSEMQRVRDGLHLSCDDPSTPRTALDTVQEVEARLRHTFSPILWGINRKRHVSPNTFHTILQERYHTPWEEKLDIALWRGALTGQGEYYNISDHESCMDFPRCRFALSNMRSPLLDVGFTVGIDSHEFFCEKNEGFSLRKELMEPAEQLRYKMLISLEGNNVASGLKWMLLSDSVVLMPPPTFTSWAMEEWLEPYVHYVPLNEDGSGAIEAARWVLDHDQEAQKIAERATLFIEDLLYYEDAKADECAVQTEVVRRYRSYYAPVLAE